MAKPKQTTSGLIANLQYIAKAQKENGTILQTHCCISNGMITAFDGVVSIGCKTEVDLECYPHTYTLLNALLKCGQEYSITQLENNRLAVKSGKFQAYVPCIEPFESKITPDANCAPVGEVLRESLARCMHLATEGASRVIESAVLIQNSTVLATDAKVLIEVWHGANLPRLTIPKIFISKLCSVNKNLTGFGFSQSSVTFHFEDEAWIKSQIFAEEFPDCSKILECVELPIAMPEGFFEAVQQIEDFAEGKEHEKTVYITEKGMSSHKDNQGAFFEFEGFPISSFKIKQLKQIEKSCKSYVKGKGRMWFFGDNCRGCIMEAF